MSELQVTRAILAAVAIVATVVAVGLVVRSSIRTQEAYSACLERAWTVQQVDAC